MHAFVDAVNRWGAEWTTLAVAAVWQSTLVALLVALAAYTLRRSSPAVRYWLWQIVAIKLLVLPVWSWSIGLPWLPAEVADGSAVEASRYDVAPALPEKTIATSAAASPASARAPTVFPGDQSTSRLSDLTWRGWLFVGWVAIVGLQCGRLCVQRVRLARLLRRAGPGDEELTATVTRLAAELKLNRPPRVLLTGVDCSPFVCGIARPALVLPGELVPTLDAAELRQVLAHEMAHLKRRDLVWGWIPEIARVLYFFHPVIHWASYRIRLERELACDQLAMTHTGRGPAEYAETLLRILGSASWSNIFHTQAAAPLDGGDGAAIGREEQT